MSLLLLGERKRNFGAFLLVSCRGHRGGLLMTSYRYISNVTSRKYRLFLSNSTPIRHSFVIEPSSPSSLPSRVASLDQFRAKFKFICTVVKMSIWLLKLIQTGSPDSFFLSLSLARTKCDVNINVCFLYPSETTRLGWI